MPGGGGGGGCTVSSPNSEEEEEEEDMEELEDDEEEQGGGEDGGHWELWLGTADWELCEGIWALAELGPLLCMPMPFSVRNSSRSMYCSWKRPPSQGSVRSHNRGPRKAELGRPAGATSAPALLWWVWDSSSESWGLALSAFISQQSFPRWSALIGSWRSDLRLAIEFECPPVEALPGGLLVPNWGLAPAGCSGVRSCVSDLDMSSRPLDSHGKKSSK